MIDDDGYLSFGPGLLRILAAHTPGPKRPDPPFFQWGDVEKEFPTDTSWETLGADELRRACSERGLAEDGIKVHLVDRLTPTKPKESDENPAKRARTDEGISPAG